MSFFGNLGNCPSSKSIEEEVVSGLPQYSYRSLLDKDEIGDGGFSVVFTAILPDDCKKKIVVKKLLDSSDEARKSLVKEARIINQLNHANIVQLKGICLDRYAVLMEYVYFDFKPFGHESIVHTLSGFLAFCEKSSCEGMHRSIFQHASFDIASGLKYLHENGIAHRDLKPENVLVSNHHYNQCSDTETVNTMTSVKPLICKLTDFGESRSRDIQTEQILKSKTTRLNRGTLGFMAPELLTNDTVVKEASIADLMKADIWAYGMVVFNLINPGLQHPYELNIKDKVRSTPITLLQELMRKNEMPIMQSKYESQHIDEWACLKITYELCTVLHPSSRASLTTVLQLVGDEMTAGSEFHENSSEMHLKVSQATAINIVDQAIIREARGDSQLSICDGGLEIADDATNSCAFLSFLIAHEMQLCRRLSWCGLASKAEEIIIVQPHVFNRFRDVSLHYDVMEAYTLLKGNNCLPGYSYSFTEEIPFQDNALSQRGKENLLKAIFAVSSRVPSFGFYTCGQFIFLIGYYKSEIFILDTHEVPSAVGGKSAGLIRRFSGNQDKAAGECCQWLWDRLGSSKLDGPQSLAIMVKSYSESNKNSSQLRENSPKLDQHSENEINDVSVQNQTTVSDDVTSVAGVQAIDVEDDVQHSPICIDDCYDTLHDEPTRPTKSSNYVPPHGPSINEADQQRSSESTKSKEVLAIWSGEEYSDFEIGLPLRSKSFSERDSDSGSDDSEGATGSRTVHHYNDNVETPVYEWTSKVKSVQEVLPVLLMPPDFQKTCTRVPNMISDDVCFILDTSNLPTHEDWKCDDMGSWKNNGVQHHVLPTPVSDEEPLISCERSEHHIKRIYLKNKSSPDLKKYITFLEKYPTLLFIQYLFDGHPHRIQLLAHGNAKKKDAPGYIRTKDSTKSRLEEVSAAKNPKSAYHKVLDERGGIRRALSPSDLPRNRDQVKYVKSTSRGQTIKHIDSLVILLTQCKREQLQHDEKAFIREVTGAPELRCVLSYNWQMEDLITFCTEPESFSVLGVDPTFNLGRFNLTVTTYRNRKVVTKEGSHHPVMIGPMLLSQSKSFDAYNYFFSKLVGLFKDARNVLAYGTDGEDELFRALKYNFPYAVHLRCFLHFRENCKTQLNKSNVPATQQKEFLADIFGRRVGDTWENGLVDAIDEDNFTTKLSLCKDAWDRKEKRYLPPNQEPSFYSYIQERSSMIYQCMARNVRRNAGLGDPPLPYYTNDSESCNAMIKRAVQFKENEISDFVREMSVLLEQQRNDVESAIFDKGPFKLAKDFRKFYVSETEWFRKRNEQRDQHMNNFHRSKMAVNHVQNEGMTTATSRESPKRRLSLDLLSANVVSFPVVALQAIVKKSEELLNREGAILPAPGNKNAFMVESQTATRPHFVELKKNGRVVCDGCPSYASAKLCAHAVAASDKAGTLENYVKWLRKNGPVSANLTSYVTYDSSKNTGKKNPKSSTANRKGGRKKSIQPVTTIVDRPLHDSRSAPLQPSSELAPSHPTIQLDSQIQPLAQTPQQILPVEQMPQQHVELTESTQQAARHVTQSNQVQQHLPADMSARISTHSNSFVPQPRSGTFQLHYLNYCPPNTRFCFGCGQALKPDNHIPHPPFNMTVVTKMLRWYIHSLSGERVSKEGNVYFHVKLECICSKQPLFSPACVEVASWLVPQLTMQHILLLRQFGMQI